MVLEDLSCISAHWLVSASSGLITEIEGPLAHLVTLGLEQEPDKPRLALNTYCRPFLVPPHFLGIWCPEGRSIRIDLLRSRSAEGLRSGRNCRLVQAVCRSHLFRDGSDCGFRSAADLAAGMHKIEVPAELATVDELIVPTSYKAMSNDDPAFALFVFLSAGRTGRSPAAEMVYGRSVSRRPAMDHARRSRSRIAPHHWRMFRRRHISSGGGWMPSG